MTIFKKIFRFFSELTSLSNEKIEEKAKNIVSSYSVDLEDIGGWADTVCCICTHQKHLRWWCTDLSITSWFSRMTATVTRLALYWLEHGWHAPKTVPPPNSVHQREIQFYISQQIFTTDYCSSPPSYKFHGLDQDRIMDAPSHPFTL